MHAQTPDSPVDRRSRHGYFLLQTEARHDSGAVAVRGVMEDLATGERHEFDCAADVAKLIALWGGEGAPGDTADSAKGGARP